MKRAFRYLLPLLLLMMLTLSALAEKYEFADDLTGEYLYPAGSDESTATYIYRYRYPQLSGDDEIAAMFNTTYAYTADDTLAFEAPMNAGLTDGAAQATIPTPEESIINAQQRAQIDRYISMLPENYRRMFVMRFLDEYSYEEIAEALEMKLGTVKTQIFRVRALMCKMITDGEKADLK